MEVHTQVLTWHNPIQVPVLDLLIMLILCQVEVTAGQMPVEEAHVSGLAHSLQDSTTVIGCLSAGACCQDGAAKGLYVLMKDSYLCWSRMSGGLTQRQ